MSTENAMNLPNDHTPENNDAPETLPRTTNIQELHGLLDTLEMDNAEIHDKYDKLMRAYAEAENRTKRAEKDRQDALKFGPIKMARDLLEVADNFERAMKQFPQSEDPKIAEIYEGLSLTEKSLHQVLSRFDVVAIETDTATKFDPNIHEVMTQIPVPDKQSGEIIDVIRKGYKIGDRLLRPSQVITVA